MRRFHYLTGTRADFGLMQSTLKIIYSSSGLDLGVLVTGMHLDSHYGLTVKEVEGSGLPIVARIPVSYNGHDGAAMARAIAKTLEGVVSAWQSTRPNALLLLGDRGEMLAGAIAALHLNVPIVHLHGGELSGTVDEPLRHAISKLAHYHFVSTQKSRERLMRMGERPDRIFVTGAPGLDGIVPQSLVPRGQLLKESGFDPNHPTALVVFHPVVQEAERAGAQTRILLSALKSINNLQSLILMPNADAGSEFIRRAIIQSSGKFSIRVHLGREKFHNWMATADVMVGNSSSGIIEAASFGVPVVNVGNRQNGRERNRNVLDVKVNHREIQRAILRQLNHGFYPRKNLYGDGRAGERIVKLLKKLDFKKNLLSKSNCY